MASVHKAICPCGYNVNIGVGGTMSNYRDYSTFPFYCQQCGLVSANIAAWIGQKIPAASSTGLGKDSNLPNCPKCGNKNIDQYGVPPASTPPGESRVAMQAWNFKTYTNGNLCPACKQMTLVFRSAHILAD